MGITSIRAIVERIDVMPIKLGPQRRDPVKAVVEIKFKTGEKVRAVELGNNKLFRIENKGESLVDQCRCGFRIVAEQYNRIVDNLTAQ